MNTENLQYAKAQLKHFTHCLNNALKSKESLSMIEYFYEQALKWENQVLKLEKQS